MLIKVISGGQTGADQASLVAATACGLSTGGAISRGFRTLEGPRPDLGDLYGLVEMPTSDYPPRTERNVVDSDATIRIATHWSSPGERLTLKLIKKHGKPYFDVNARTPCDYVTVVNWLQTVDPTVLNVAGNSEETSPGIHDFAVKFLISVFRQLLTDHKP